MKPDIVIADYNLPGGMTGLETIAGLRGALHRELPAIILTGDISTGTLRKIAQGRCVHLNKPANAEDLTGLIASMLGAPALRSNGANGHEPPLIAHAKTLPSVKPNGDPTPATVFVVDDDPALRATMVELLELDGRAVETYSSCEAFLETYIPSRKGCLIVDAQMQGMGGLALLEWLKSEKSELPSIMITGIWRRVDGRQSHESRRHGFHREADTSRRIARQHRERAGPRRRIRASGSAWHATAAKCIADLTPREHQVMELVLAGHPSKNIAADLGVSQRTVENHRAAIMKKTGSKSIPALIRLVLAAV